MRDTDIDIDAPDEDVGFRVCTEKIEDSRCRV